jgi:hypothetical protein
MMRPRCRRRSFSSLTSSITIESTKQAGFVLAIVLAGLPCLAQQAPATEPAPPAAATAQPPASVTIPAGTRVALVLTHPIQSRHLQRGDDIYAQVSSPVDSGNEVVIPAGTFVQGTVDQLGRNGSRGELHLQSMAITFPDGYIAPISGPITLQSDEGYAIKDPGQKRMAEAFLLPAGGAGLGALIGHSVGRSQSSVTSPFPPGCVGGPPFCTTTTTPVFGTKGRDAIIGAGIGGAIGMAASFGVLFRTHHFYVDAGAPVTMTLQQPLTLQQNEVAEAVRRSLEHPVYQQPVAPRPIFIPPAESTPGTPPIIIPATPGQPPTVIPGTPPNGTQ